MKLPSGVKLSGPIEQHLDLGGLKARRAVQGVGHEGFELVPVLVEQFKLEGARNGVHLPGLGLGLEAPHDQAADLFLVVDEAVGVAHHRQHRMHAIDLSGDDVEVLGGVERHIDPGQCAELACPLPCAVHQHFAPHVTLAGPDTHSPSAFDDDPGDLDVFHDLHTAIARPFGQRHAQVRRVGLAVPGQPDGALQIVGAHHRVTLARFPG
jgi:hypothetical protein